MTVIAQSRVRDTRKPITSRSAASQAAKALDTLETAQAILRASTGSGNHYAADLFQMQIDQLTRELAAWHRQKEEKRE